MVGNLVAGALQIEIYPCFLLKSGLKGEEAVDPASWGIWDQ
jgi:hypothetical protein